jgi:hypothetical protein
LDQRSTAFHFQINREHEANTVQAKPTKCRVDMEMEMEMEMEMQSPQPIGRLGILVVRKLGVAC